MRWKRDIVEWGQVGVLFAGLIGGVWMGVNFIFTGNPFTFPVVPQNSSCVEGVHVTHNGQPIANLAIKQLGTGVYTWAITNSTGYGILSMCNPVTVVITFQATDYAFKLEPHQIVEASI